MQVAISHDPGAPEEQVVEEMAQEGFAAAPKDYPSGKTEPHHHDYDVYLYIMEGEFRLRLDAQTVHICRPGDRVRVPRGTVHSEEHGPLRMIVGRRH